MSVYSKPFVLLVFLAVMAAHSKSESKCLRLQMARMEMDCSLKNWANLLKFMPLCLGKLATTLIIVYSLFKSSLDIFLLVCH